MTYKIENRQQKVHILEKSVVNLVNIWSNYLELIIYPVSDPESQTKSTFAHTVYSKPGPL